MSAPRSLGDRFLEWQDRWGWKIFWWLCYLGTGAAMLIWDPVDMSNGAELVAVPIAALFGAGMVWLLLLVPVIVLYCLVAFVLGIVDNIRGAE